MSSYIGNQVRETIQQLKMEANGAEAGEETQEDILEKVNIMYKRLMSERKNELVRRLDHVYDVIERLVKLEVLKEHERKALMSKHIIRQHQKEALISILAGKSFVYIKLILAGLYDGVNTNAELILRINLVIKTIYIVNPRFDRNQLKKVPRLPQDITTDGVGLALGKGAPRYRKTAHRAGNPCNDINVVDDPTSDPGPSLISLLAESSVLNSRCHSVELLGSSTEIYKTKLCTVVSLPSPDSNHIRSSEHVEVGHSVDSYECSSTTPNGHQGDASACADLNSIMPFSNPSSGDGDGTAGPSSCQSISSISVSSAEQTCADEPSLPFYNEAVCAGIRTIVEVETVSALEAYFKAVNKLDDLVDTDRKTRRTSLHACVSREQYVEACLEKLLKRHRELVDIEKRRSGCSETSLPPTCDFIDLVDMEGQTAAHLAAHNNLVEVIKLLYGSSRCDLLIKDKYDQTPLEIMYLKAPEAVRFLLDDAIIGTSGSPTDPAYKMEIDFTFITGQSASESSNYEEMALLAGLVGQKHAQSRILLSHVLVKLFIHFKWNKMRFWLYFSTLLQLFLHSWYAIYIVQVFVVSCRFRGIYNGTDTIDNLTEHSPQPIFRKVPESIAEYMFGKWEDELPDAGQPCGLDSFWTVQSIGILFLGIFFLLKAAVEMGVKINKIVFRRIHTSWVNSFQGLLDYYRTTSEHIYLTVCGVLMIIVARHVFSGRIYESDYACAAMSLLITAKPILIHVGELTGLCIYVRIFGKVTRHFTKLMIVYVFIILAFALALSIVFPDDYSFRRLPESIIKVFTMMVGEFEYISLFHSQENLHKPKLVIASHLIIICLIILLTIILTNLLVGLVVTDVKELKESAGIYMLASRVDKLAMVENTLKRLRPIFCGLHWIRCVSRGNNPEDEFEMDVHVIPKATKSGLVISMKIIPEEMRKALIKVALKEASPKKTYRDEEPVPNLLE